VELVRDVIGCKATDEEAAEKCRSTGIDNCSGFVAFRFLTISHWEDR
jgi:hypothetical protein